jgi:hypothetical protein
VSGQFGDGTPFEKIGQVILQGLLVGDLNFDYSVDISDIVILTDYLFQGGPPPVYMESGDFNQDNSVDISDMVKLVEKVFGPVSPAK